MGSYPPEIGFYIEFRDWGSRVFGSCRKMLHSRHAKEAN